MPDIFEQPASTGIIAKFDDPRDGFCLAVTAEFDAAVMSDFDLEAAIRAAVADYAETEDGAKNEQIRQHDFNWSDAANDLPEEIYLKHGFRIKDRIVFHNIVDHDENLLPD